MNTDTTAVAAVATHERVNWEGDELPDIIKDHTVAVVMTDAGNWIAVCDMEANVGEPVTVVQTMKSSKLRRHGRVLAQWDGSKQKPMGYWPTDVPARMPLYMAQAA